MSNVQDNFDREIAEAIQMFIDNLPGKFTDICENYEARNTPRLRELIHDLKGTSGNFGYDDLFAISQQMENLLKSDLLNEFGGMLLAAEKIVQAVLLHPEKSSLML